MIRNMASVHLLAVFSFCTAAMCSTVNSRAQAPPPNGFPDLLLIRDIQPWHLLWLPI